MPRTIIDIPNGQLQELDRLCKLLGLSRAEGVRRALQGYIDGNAEVSTEGFGLWKRTEQDAAPRRVGRAPT